jgi:hypothetical protein
VVAICLIGLALVIAKDDIFGPPTDRALADAVGIEADGGHPHTG